MILPIEKGHFLYESGHHSDQWIRLELLFLQPERIRPLADDLADRLSKYVIDAVCGPLVEGAFVALTVASRIGVAFTYAERSENPIGYRIPGALRREVSERRIAIVNDVISAGSAVRGTFADLTTSGAETVVVGALAVLGDAFPQFAVENNLALETLEQLPNQIWMPAECPLCAAGVQLEDLARIQSPQRH